MCIRDRSSDDPIKVKLRGLGVEIISDIHLLQRQDKGRIGAINATNKIIEMVSFLDIAHTMNLISEMNSGILKKEFLEFKRSIDESINVKPVWLEEFLSQSPVEETQNTEVDGLQTPGRFFKHVSFIKNGEDLKGHVQHKDGTRIGVQKGSTLMTALRKVSGMSDKMNFSAPTSPSVSLSRAQDFDLLKKKRRTDIINILKISGGSSTIKDIKSRINIGIQESLACSEKTLQRELMSMTTDGVLDKAGEKRWSRYSLKV